MCMIGKNDRSKIGHTIFISCSYATMRPVRGVFAYHSSPRTSEQDWRQTLASPTASREGMTHAQ
jgi:hypothetical protein